MIRLLLYKFISNLRRLILQHSFIKGSFTLSQSEREFLSLIFVVALCEHYIGFSVNPSGSDVAFPPIYKNP